MLRGCEEPRVYTPPLRELTPDTTLGYDVIAFAEEVLRISLHPWQRWLFIHALEIVGDFDGEWRFRFRTVLVLIARQNGKTTMGAVLSLFFLYVVQVSLILGTAQDLEQAEDTWSRVVEIAEGDERLKSEIEHVWHTNGAKRLQLTNGRDYRVKASTRKAGRGKSADLILLDELREHQSWDAWGALTKTGMARDNALTWCMSNAGDGTSCVLRHLRAMAHMPLGDPDKFCDGVVAMGPDDEDDEDDDSLGIFEWSADPSLAPNDRTAWAHANPSLGYSVSERALKSAYKTDPPDVFKTECLCQWVTATIAPPFPVGAWDAGKDEHSEIAIDSPIWYGVDMSADRGKASIAVCGMRPDRKWHIELVAYSRGVGWLQDWFAQRAHNDRMMVALQSRGAPISSMLEILEAVDGVEIIECAGKDVAAWSGRLYGAVCACADDSDSDETPVYHRTQPALDLAANIATTRPMGDGVWAWDRAKSMEDISPLVACTMAFGAATMVVEEEKPVKSAYEDEDVLIL